MPTKREFEPLLASIERALAALDNRADSGGARRSRPGAAESLQHLCSHLQTCARRERRGLLGVGAGSGTHRSRHLMRDAGPHYRRSPHIVSYWAHGRLVFHNFATGTRVAGSALTIGLLDYFDSWKPADPLLKRSTLPAAELRKAVAKLVRSSLLQQSGRRPSKAETIMEQWAEWNPAAGFLHFSNEGPAIRSG